MPGTRGSGCGWRAIAAWRGVENANLSFHPDGIRDWGADEPHTPLNAVILALRVDPVAAVHRLANRIGLSPPLSETPHRIGFHQSIKPVVRPTNRHDMTELSIQVAARLRPLDSNTIP